MLIFISYMIKVSISLALFYMLYKLLLSKDTNHKYKRLTILLSICTAFAMPLLANLIPANEISSTPIQKVREFIEIPLPETPTLSPNSSQTILEESNPIKINWTSLIYWGIIGLLCIRLLISYQSVIKWLRKATIKPYKNILLAIVDDTIQAFSFLKYIVISKQDYEENKTLILIHEEAHIRLHHSVDVILLELVCYLQWFNPFAWLLKRELKLVHEFQADQAVLNTGIDATQYQLLILEKAVGKRRFAVANHFKQKPISKRLKMMKKKQINRWSVAKALLFIPAGILLLQAFTQPEIIKKVNKLPPLITQSDSSELWLSQWTLENLPLSTNNIVTNHTNLSKIGNETTDTKIKQRNVLQILQNRKGSLLVNGKITKKEELSMIVKSFLQGKDYWGGVGPEIQEISFGEDNKTQISKGVILYQFDRQTSEQAISQSIGKAHLQVRELETQKLFNKNYFKLKGSERNFIDKTVPIRVSQQPARDKSAPITIKIDVTHKGILLGGKLCPINQLATKIKPHMLKNPNAIVHLVAEEEITMGTITDIKQELRKAGVKKLNYSIEKL